MLKSFVNHYPRGDEETELLFRDTARVIRQKCFLFVCSCDFICRCCLNERKFCGDLTNIQSKFAPALSVGTCVCVWAFGFCFLFMTISHIVHEPVMQTKDVLSYRKVGSDEKPGKQAKVWDFNISSGREPENCVPILSHSLLIEAPLHSLSFKHGCTSILHCPSPALNAHPDERQLLVTSLISHPVPLPLAFNARPITLRQAATCCSLSDGDNRDRRAKMASKRPSSGLFPQGRGRGGHVSAQPILTHVFRNKLASLLKSLLWPMNIWCGQACGVEGYNDRVLSFLARPRGGRQTAQPRILHFSLEIRKSPI